jgi:hypothetical protein
MDEKIEETKQSRRQQAVNERKVENGLILFTDCEIDKIE